MWGYVSLCLILLGCGTYNPTTNNVQYVSLPIPVSDEVIVIENNRSLILQANDLGHFVIEQNLNGINCSFDSVRRLAIEKSKSIGGNGVLITSHRYPNRQSPCHGIDFNVYELSDPSDFKKESQWREGKKLDYSDFKGDFRSKPFNASTLSYIRHYIWAPENTSKPVITVETVFDMYQSFLKADVDIAMALRHEQIHFDITELYARKFTKLLRKKVRSHKDYLEKQEELFKEVQSALFSKQKEYDASVYNHPDRLEEWEKWISQALHDYRKYSNKTFVLKR